jgi:DNA invertase Pin-like site-specific DNA recombinase
MDGATFTLATPTFEELRAAGLLALGCGRACLLTVHILAAVAEHEREMISQRRGQPLSGL